VNEVDPLTCPKCSGKMKIISVIEDEEIIDPEYQEIYPPVEGHSA
jgi:hypothetical protein